MEKSIAQTEASHRTPYNKEITQAKYHKLWKYKVLIPLSELQKWANRGETEGENKIDLKNMTGLKKPGLELIQSPSLTCWKLT